MKIISWIIGILGIWVIISAIFALDPVVIQWSNFATGAIIAFLGFMFVEDLKIYGWLASVVGLWIFMCAFIEDLHTGLGLTLNGIIAGIAAVTVALYMYNSRKKGGRASKEGQLIND